MADQNHKPQSGDRNLDYVSKNDKLQQEHREKETRKGEKEMDDATKRDEGIR